MAEAEQTAPDPTGRTPAAGRMPAIDVLRGTAILLVILYHINNLIIFPHGIGLMSRNPDGSMRLPDGVGILRLLFLPSHMGRVGVNLFFVISGLCIHLRFARQQAANPQAPFSLSTFFLRRFYRIYPAYWAALAVGAFVAPFLYAAVYPNGAPGEAASGVPALSNIAAHAVMVHSFSKDTMMSIIASLWSIATEEQFYLLYPLLFVLIGRRLPVSRIVVGLLALTVVWRLTLILTNPPPLTFSDGPFLVWIFGFSLPRYYEWSLGALLASAMATGKTLPELLSFLPARLRALLGARPRLLGLVGIGLILLGGASLLRVQLKYLIEDPCYSTGWFLIMAAVLLPSPAAATAAARRPATGPVTGPLSAVRRWAAARLENLGRRSFSVYLLHEIVLFTTAGLMFRFNLPPILVAAPLGAALIWAVCYPFYHFIEAPFEARSKRVGREELARRPEQRQPVGADALG